MHDHGMLDNIVEHSVVVSRLALFLADHLVLQGLNLNRSLIEAGALLHDITKTRSLTTGEPHAETGARLLRSRGYDAVAVIVEEHVYRKTYDATTSPVEEDIINYADKRVLHSTVVTLERRFSYLTARYGKTSTDQERIAQLFNKTQQLEGKMFYFLPFSPSYLTQERITHAGCRRGYPSLQDVIHA